MITNHDHRAPSQRSTVSRRLALQGFGGLGMAALTLAAPRWAGATSEDRIARSYFGSLAGDDPAAIVDKYITAVNAENLEGILNLYADEAVHIFLPTPDGSAGVCRGKDQFRMWYEQSLVHHDSVELAPETLAVDGNQATFVVQMRSDPWRELGLETLQAQAQLVVIDGRIMTHVEILSPDSLRALQTARAGSAEVAVPHGIHGLW